MTAAVSEVYVQPLIHPSPPGGGPAPGSGDTLPSGCERGGPDWGGGGWAAGSAEGPRRQTVWVSDLQNEVPGRTDCVALRRRPSALGLDGSAGR